MRSANVGGLLVVLLATSACVPTQHWHGPLPVRNQHPAQLTVLHMAPARAAALAPGVAELRFDSAYTSLWLSGQDGNRTWLMDGEYLRVAPGARVGLGHGLQLGVEVPFAHTSGGFLDDFVIDYHGWFGFPDQGRDAAPRNQFAIAATRGNQTVWSVERDSAALLDVPIGLHWEVLPAAPGRPGLAVRTAIELPTGDANAGYGSGELEAALGVVGELQVLGLGLYAHAQHTFAGTPDVARRTGSDFADVTAFGVGVEAPLTADLAALLQVGHETSTLREFGLRATAREQVLLWAGARWQVGPRCAVEVALGEDLVGLVSPDFTAWVGLSFGFGGTSPQGAPPATW